MQTMAESDLYQNVYHCPMSECSFLAGTPNEWLAHLRSSSHDQPFKDVTCCMEDCSETFNSFSGIKSHIYRHHQGMKRSNVNVEQGDDNRIDEVESDPEDMNSFTELDDDLEADVSHLLGRDTLQQKRESALFLMRMKEVRRLSQTSLDDIVIGCRSLFDLTVKRMRAGVRQKLAQVGGDLHITDEMFDEMQDPFTGLESEYLQAKYITKEFHVVVSKYDRPTERGGRRYLHEEL